MGMIDSSRSALIAFQRALATTSHNIANVNTEGYSRQTVNFQTVGSTNPTDRAAPGGGVNIHSLNRAYDGLLENGVRQDNAAYNRSDIFGSLATDVDILFASGESNISTQLQSLFSAFQDVSNDPTSISTRQVMIGESEMLTGRLREMDGRLKEMSDFSNARLTQVVSEINSFSQQIADINAKIKDSGENIPNDLLDSRDHLITQLSERVSVSTVESGDGMTNVFVGNGQAMVVGTNAETIGVSRSEFGDGLRIILGQSGTGPDATEQLSGGVIGGILDFQSDILRPAENEIGRIAAALAESMNELHSSGYDLDGDTGVDLFSIDDPNVASSTNNTGGAVVSASFVRTTADAYDIDSSGSVDATDIKQLRDNWQASDYQLEYQSGSWKLTRLSDNSDVTLTANTNIPPTLTATDGFVVNVAGGAANEGDKFLIRPFQYAASDIQVAISNPRDFAAANSFDPSYELEYQGGNDWKITRESDGLSTIVTNDGLPADSILTAADSTSSGLFDEGFEITLPGGVPVIGDTYTIHPFDSTQSELTTTVINKTQVVERNVLNTSGWDTYSGGIRVGNNENAIAISDLQTAKLIGNGSSTINDAYNQLVSSVGIQANQARVSGEAQGIMLEQSKLARDAVSGVNLDEEAADLIRFQQAYQAAAKVMAAADQMFKSLMNSLG